MSKTIELPALPRPVTFGTNTAITPTVERGQVESITVQKGSGKQERTHEIYKDGEFVKGLNPVQAEFIFNSVMGALGSARADRSLGFAEWTAVITDQYSDEINLDSLSKWNVITEFASRGGTMVYPLVDLIEVCHIISRNARNSLELYPREDKSPTRRTSKVEEVEVEIEL